MKQRLIPSSENGGREWHLGMAHTFHDFGQTLVHNCQVSSLPTLSLDSTSSAAARRLNFLLNESTRKLRDQR